MGGGDSLIGSGTDNVFPSCNIHLIYFCNQFCILSAVTSFTYTVSVRIKITLTSFPSVPVAVIVIADFRTLKRVNTVNCSNSEGSCIDSFFVNSMRVIIRPLYTETYRAACFAFKYTRYPAWKSPFAAPSVLHVFRQNHISCRKHNCLS